MNSSKWLTQTISIDLLILLLVAPAAIQSQEDAYLIVVMLLAYLLISLRLPLSSNAEDSTMPQRISFLLRYSCLLIMVAASVVLPTVLNVLERQITPVEADGFSPAYADISDSAVQTESALTYLANGQNPYVERYEETPLRFYQWVDPGEDDWRDPAYEYFVYLPGSLLLSFPFYSLATTFDLFYDQRLIYLLIFIILILFLPQLAGLPANKLALVAGIGLNPLFIEPVRLGMNDVAPFFGLVISLVFLTRRRFLWAAVFFGLAVALKQYAWFIGPFYLLYVWEQSEAGEKLRNVALSFGCIGLIFTLVCLPFFLWDPMAFYTDTFAFPAGRADLLYPIRGFTIGRLLIGAGLIPTFVSPFPFQTLQLIIGLPVLLLLLLYQRGRDLGMMLLAAAAFIFVFGFLSRFFHHNYVGVVVALATLGFLLHVDIEMGREADR